MSNKGIFLEVTEDHTVKPGGAGFDDIPAVVEGIQAVKYEVVHIGGTLTVNNVGEIKKLLTHLVRISRNVPVGLMYAALYVQLMCG